jgi:hypothetical protein
MLHENVMKAFPVYRRNVNRCCVTIGQVMKEHELILRVLRDLSRRLWLARAIREAVFAVCVILFNLVCLELVQPAFASQSTSSGISLRMACLTAFAVVVLEIVWKIARMVTTEQAAADADAGAKLKDELRSARWFLTQTAMSPFEQLQVQRAARTAAGLDLASIAPRALPGSSFLAAGLGLALAALFWLTPQQSQSAWNSGQEGDLEKYRDLRSLLSNAPEDAGIAKLDIALGALQRSDTPPQERMRAMADVRDAVEQANMEASAAREVVAKLAESLKLDPKFEQVTRAMNEGRMDDAMALLRKLETATGDMPEEQSRQPAGKGDAPDTNTGKALESSGQDLNATSATVNQDALDRVISALEQSRERIEIQNRVNAVRRHMEDNLIARTQRNQLTASQFGSRANAPNPTPSPQTGNADVRGGALFRQAAVAREDDDTVREGSQAGDASGDSAALPLEGAATKRLDAQLKLETILQKGELANEPNGKADPGWFYSASREQKSMLQPENVRSNANHDREAALHHDSVPIRQQGIVKNYFLHLHESEKK